MSSLSSSTLFPLVSGERVLSPAPHGGTSVGTAGGSLAEQDESQERIEVMPNAGSRACANPTLPPVLGDGRARLLHLRDTFHGANHRLQHGLLRRREDRHHTVRRIAQIPHHGSGAAAIIHRQE